MSSPMPETMMFAIRQARFADALDLAGRLRFEDAREIASVWGVGASTGLCYCLLHSDRAFTVDAAGVPVALWGLTATTTAGLQIGIPWLLAAEDLFAHPRLIAVRGRRWVRDLLLDYDVLTNLTDAGNAAHLRWLAWCGFLPLRQHERHGALGRRFVEFFLVNDQRHEVVDGVRQVLLGRSPPSGGLLLEPPLRRLMEHGMAVLRRPPDQAEPDLTGLADCLHCLQEGGWPEMMPRTRRALAALLLEIAVRQAGRDRDDRRWESSHDFWRALAALAELAPLEAANAGAEQVVGALAPAPQAPAPAGLAPAGISEAPFRPGSPDGDGAAGIVLLARRYLHQLSDGGRWPCIHGYRLRAAALDIDERWRRPFGVCVQELDRRIREYYLARSLQMDSGDTVTALARTRAARLHQPVSHGCAMAALRACAGDGALGRLVEPMLDRWAVAGGVGGGAVLPATNFGAVLTLVSAVADRLALQALPSLRLGIVVSGYADRHWLYRLLRARLLLAVSGSDGPMASRLLGEDVTALLLAARFEGALLQSRQPDTALRSCLDLFGADGVTAEGLEYLTSLLMPAVAVPVVHAAQLEPALFVWHLTTAGGIEDAMAAIADLLDDGGRMPRQPFRSAVRRLARELGPPPIEHLLAAGSAS